SILFPHPDVLGPPSHDPQTVRDAMETGHEEPRLLMKVETRAGESSSSRIPVVPLEESLCFCGRERLCHSQDTNHCSSSSTSSSSSSSSSAPLTPTGLTAHHSPTSPGTTAPW
ncbi:hypothetical protein INR49_008874, partial [Caranx melampygus]